MILGGGQAGRGKGVIDGPPLVFVQDGPAVNVLVVVEVREVGVVDSDVVRGMVWVWGKKREGVEAGVSGS